MSIHDERDVGLTDEEFHRRLKIQTVGGSIMAIAGILFGLYLLADIAIRSWFS